MNYTFPNILHNPVGNNAFAYDTRTRKTLFIPALRDGTINDVKVGSHVVFSDTENSILRECVGLESFININWKHKSGNTKLTVFDNHNHALYFWIEAVRKGIVSPGFTLIHIDEHSDLWDNSNILNLPKAVEDESYAWEFTNFHCNVGNYIKPALESGIIGKMIRIENEFQIDEFIDYIPEENAILNLDLDIFAPELDYIDERKKIACIQNLLSQVKYVTIATSPYFIDQGLAIEKLIKCLKRND